MSLLSRLKDLVRANLNDLISKAEDPEKMLNLFIEDATEQFRAFGVEVNRFEAERLLIVDQIKTCESLIKDWHAKARLALSQSREDLAKQALEKEQKEQAKLTRLQEDLVQAEHTSSQMQEQYRLLQEKLEEAKERRDDLVRRNRLAAVQKQAAEAVSGLNLGDPLSKFDRMEDKVQRKEAEAMAASTTMKASLNYQFDQLERVKSNQAVDDALEKLRAELDSEPESK